MTRVLLADDHPVVTEGLRRIVASVPGLKVVGEARTGAEVLTQLVRNPVEVLVLDSTLPDRCPLDLLKRIANRWPRTRVLLLGTGPDDPVAVRAIRDGAAGFAAKSQSPLELRAAVERIAAGCRYVHPAVAERLMFAAPGDGGPSHESLSGREFEVLCLMGAGRPPREIGPRLGISVKTVATHRARILEKLGLDCTAAAIAHAVKHGLL